MSQENIAGGVGTCRYCGHTLPNIVLHQLHCVKNPSAIPHGAVGVETTNKVCVPAHPVASPAGVERQLLQEIAAVIKERAIGHAIVYSDRITGFLPRIKEVLATPPAIPQRPVASGEDKLLAECAECATAIRHNIDEDMGGVPDGDIWLTTIRAHAGVILDNLAAYAARSAGGEEGT